MFKTTRRLTMAGAAALAAGITGRRASAQDATVKIGVIYPLSGNSATAGNYSKMALEVGADVVNNGNADLAKLIPLAKGGGLPGLKGAKIQLIFADNQGTPAAGQNQALRLITEEKVVALIGEVGRDGSLTIIGKGAVPATGLKKGVVVNIDQTVTSIANAVGRRILRTRSPGAPFPPPEGPQRAVHQHWRPRSRCG